MSQPTTPIEHPLVHAVEVVAQGLDEAAGANPVYLTTRQKERVLTDLAREKARLEALEHRVLAAADDVAVEHGARDAGAWLAHATRQDAPVGRRWQRLADGLDSRWPMLAEAYAAGQVSTAQVQVIGRALDDLPEELDPDLRVRAEKQLVVDAAHFTPRQLRILGHKILEVLAPEVAEAHEARLLEEEEQAAWDKASLTWHRCGNGMSRARVTLPDAVMDRWLTLLHAFSSPRREGATSPDDRRPYPTKLAHAFQSLLERIPEDWLPRHGGATTSVVVTIDADRLEKDLAAAGLTTGTPITAGEARRLACTAGILPLVLNGTSQPLDLGRTKRLFTPGQRKALAVRDRHCRAEGCETPAAWCGAHHAREPWGRGGNTDLADGLLLCPFHHHRAHDTRYDHGRMPNGDLRFHRRT